MKKTEDESDPEDLLENLRVRGFMPIVEAAAALHKVTVYDVVGRGRCASSVRARHETIARLYTEELRSAPEVGALLDMDHSTVLAALEKLGVQRRTKGGVKAVGVGKSGGEGKAA